MRADDLRELLNQRPFEPVRLHISSGQAVDIWHPELAIVSRSLVMVGVGRGDRADEPGEPDRVVHHFAHYNLLHIVKIEPINGQRPKGPRPKGPRPKRRKTKPK